MEGKKIVCAQCNEAFYLTSEEMEKMLSKGFGLPKRCPDCRKKKNKMGKSPEDFGRTRGRKRNSRRDYFDEDDYSY